MENNKSGCHGKCRLSVCGFSLAAGTTWGLMTIALGLMATYLEVGGAWVTLLGSVYKGYAATYMGSLIGGGWAALDGLICGFVFSVIYNLVTRKCCGHSCSPSMQESN